VTGKSLFSETTDYSRYCWVYFTKTKDAKAISDVYETLHRNAENKASTQVSFLQTDGSGE
jgi:hypothetical protein